MAAAEFSILFDKNGTPIKGTTCDNPDPVDVGPTVDASKGQRAIPEPIEDIVAITLVRTRGNPTCCWWIRLSDGQMYCMPVQCP